MILNADGVSITFVEGGKRPCGSARQSRYIKSGRGHDCILAASSFEPQGDTYFCPAQK